MGAPTTKVKAWEKYIHIANGRSGDQVLIEDKDRPMGIHLVAGRGSGKSHFMGRDIVFDDAYRSIPTVVFDAVGNTVNNFLKKVYGNITTEGGLIEDRIRYIDTHSLNGYVMPTPFYSRQANDETMVDIADRLIEVISRTDPALTEAPIQGMNAIRQVGLYAGIILQALGFQITEVEGLLNKKPEWDKILKGLSEEWFVTPEISKAIDFFQNEYSKNQSLMFKSKLTDILLSPVNRAIFGASQPAINWSEVFSKNLCVLIDTSRETNRTMRAFKTLWVFRSLMSYIQSRGTGREKPISIVIDELASMYSSTGNMIADDINELINVVSRNYNIWLTIAHQEMFQFDEPTRKALMTLGTQMVGHTDDSDAAMFFAKRFDYIDPYDVKDVRKQFGSHTKQTFTKTRTIRGRDWGYDADHNPVYFDETHYDDDDEDNTETTHEVIDEWNTYHSPEEQLLTESYGYHSQIQGHFFVKLASDSHTLISAYTTDSPSGAESDYEVYKRKLELMKRYGRGIDDIQAEIETRISSKISEYEERRNNISEQPDPFEDIFKQINKQKEEKKAKDNEDDFFK